MEYRKLKNDSLPPIDNRKRFILWRGVLDDDGGFPAIAKRVQYGDNPPYIMFTTIKGWKALQREEYKECLWSEIETPPQIAARQERKALRQREREKRKASAKQSA